MSAETSNFKDFLKNIEQQILKLTNLEIRTIVGDYTLTPDDEIAPIAGGDFKVIKTKINLIDGDVSTYISNALVQPEYVWLQELHARKEEKGHEIIHNNIRAIISLIELYKAAKNTPTNS